MLTQNSKLLYNKVDIAAMPQHCGVVHEPSTEHSFKNCDRSTRFEIMDSSFVLDGVCVRGNALTQEVPTKVKSASKDSCSAYKGHLTRIYQQRLDILNLSLNPASRDFISD